MSAPSDDAIQRAPPEHTLSLTPPPSPGKRPEATGAPTPLELPYAGAMDDAALLASSEAAASDGKHGTPARAPRPAPGPGPEAWQRPGLSPRERWRAWAAEQACAWACARAECRELGTARVALRWLRGPARPRAMHIKHYPWWPWAPVERAWILWTDPVAWKDPALAHAPARAPWLAPTRVHPAAAAPDLEGDAHGPPRARNPLAREPGDDDDERDSQGQPPSAWGRGVLRDLRLNFVHWLVLCATCIGWIFGFAVIARDLWYRSSASVSPALLSSSTAASSPSSSSSSSSSLLHTADAVTSVSPVSYYSCTASYWEQNAGCGLDGSECGPFASTTGSAFRCPKSCLGTTLGNVRAVGAQTVNWVPLLVGGGDADQTYRADSWVCQSAVQAGLFSDDTGGCGVLDFVGTYSGFIGADRHGAHSLSFNSTFPMAYRFLPADGAQCQDQRWKGYVLDVVLSAWTTFVLRPKTIVLYWILVCLGFWHINMFSEPRSLPPPVGEAFGDFLPCLFGAYVIWKVSIRFVLPAFRHVPIEGSILWLAWYWIGTLLDVVFANVPLNRLVGSDLASQPGAIPSLIVIVIVIVVLAINQVVFVIRRQGYLPKYLALYIVGGIIVGLLAAIPGETVRVHHYILGLALLPGVGFPTRISLMAAALLLGMYLNGIGRWGFDGLIQDDSVVRGDGPSGSDLPRFASNSTSWAGVRPLPNATGAVHWHPIPADLAQSYDSMALIVDDVLRYQGSATSYDLGQLYASFSANASALPHNDTAAIAAAHRTAHALASEPHFLRLAYVSQGSYGDFTMAATAYFNGSWIDAPTGRT